MIFACQCCIGCCTLGCFFCHAARPCSALSIHPAGAQPWILPSAPPPPPLAPQDVTPYKQNSLSLAVTVARHALSLVGTPLAHGSCTLLFPVAQDQATAAPTRLPSYYQGSKHQKNMPKKLCNMGCSLMIAAVALMLAGVTEETIGVHRHHIIPLQHEKLFMYTTLSLYPQLLVSNL